MSQLATAWRSRPVGYRPDTRHLQSDGTPRYLNRLFLQNSAYLQQHAHNPVDWRPWGPEALAAARLLHRPIFLSVGYATCHWCHVMAEESFEDEATARLINENFIAIKVDREERPDVDAMASSALHTMGVPGGWPTTLWLTAEGQPFVGGTYYPPRDGVAGQPGLPTVLRTIAAAAHDEPDRLQSTAQERVRAMQGAVPPAPMGDPHAVIAAAVSAVRSAYDPVDGGMRGTRKFPGALPVQFLLRRYRSGHDASALTMVGQTLQHMAAGGLQDQLGGGFHRYTVDAQWRVPHFEKMLYDQATLLVAYTEAYQASGADDLLAVAQHTAQALLRDFSVADGGFAAGWDADSADNRDVMREGVYYTWTVPEVQAALGPQAAWAVQAFHLQGPPQVEGRYVLNRLDAPSVAANANALAALLKVRAQRPAPRLDDLVVSAWNGLTLDALARSAAVLQDANVLDAARRTGTWIVHTLQPHGELVHSLRRGKAGPPAFFDDTAACTAGLISLYEATGELPWLRAALALDAQGYAVWRDGQQMTVRADLQAVGTLPNADGDVPVPSSLSLQALNLLRLAELTERADLQARAQTLVQRLAGMVARAPLAWPAALVALDWQTHGVKQLVLVAPNQRAELQPWVQALARSFVPYRVQHLTVQGEPAASEVPTLQGKVARDGRVTAYVCEGHTCKAPTQDPNVMLQQL